MSVPCQIPPTISYLRKSVRSPTLNFQKRVAIVIPWIFFSILQFGINNGLMKIQIHSTTKGFLGPILKFLRCTWKFYDFSIFKIYKSFRCKRKQSEPEGWFFKRSLMDISSTLGTISEYSLLHAKKLAFQSKIFVICENL